MNSTASPVHTSVAPKGKCELLGPFAILVQGALGILALSSLVFKRWRERPQRPVKIWAFDASKQVFGSILLHLANLLMSMFSSGELEAKLAVAAAKAVGGGSQDGDWQPNPCSFYLLNLGIDTTLGIPILIVILKILHIGFSKTPLANPPESLKSGNYGDPPRVTWWLKQSVVYFIGLLLMKLCVFFVIELLPWIVVAGDWALKWTEGNEALQIAFVMLIFPLIMNALQYYIIDTFIKNRPDSDGTSEQTIQQVPEEEGGLLAGQDGRGHSSDDDEEGAHPNRIHSTNFKHTSQEGYDPIRDGEVETLRAEGNSSSTSSIANKPPHR